MHAPTSTFPNTHDHMDILNFRSDLHFQDTFGILDLKHLNLFYKLLNFKIPGLPSPAMHVGVRGTQPETVGSNNIVPTTQALIRRCHIIQNLVSTTQMQFSQITTTKIGTQILVHLFTSQVIGQTQIQTLIVLRVKLFPVQMVCFTQCEFRLGQCIIWFWIYKIIIYSLCANFEA